MKAYLMQDELKSVIIGLAMFLVRNNPDSICIDKETLYELAYLIDLELASFEDEGRKLH